MTQSISTDLDWIRYCMREAASNFVRAGIFVKGVQHSVAEARHWDRPIIESGHGGRIRTCYDVLLKAMGLPTCGFVQKDPPSPGGKRCSTLAALK